jgi:hypothetical protein
MDRWRVGDFTGGMSQHAVYGPFSEWPTTRISTSVIGAVQSLGAMAVFLALPLDRGCSVNERRLEPCCRPVRARPSRPYSTNAIPDLLPQSCKNFLHFFLAGVEGVVRGDLWDRNLPSYLCNVFFRYAFALQQGF